MCKVCNLIVYCGSFFFGVGVGVDHILYLHFVNISDVFFLLYFRNKHFFQRVYIPAISISIPTSISIILLACYLKELAECQVPEKI